MRLLNLFFLPALFAAFVSGCAPETFQEEKKKPDEFYPVVRYSMLVNEYCPEEGVIRPNQQFIDLLNGRPVSAKAIRQLNTLPRKTFDFRSVRAGDRFVRFVHEWSDSVSALVIEHDPVHYTVFHFNDSLRVERCENPVTVSEKVATGAIESNLSETIQSMGISHVLTNRFVDIFAWQVDFHHLQKGDHFKIMYEEHSVSGKPFDIGRITGIYFNHNNKPNWAIPFDQGKGVDYFDEEGNSIRKALLKYPIEFTRISSRYNPNRFHPVLKITRAHLGTDLAAATGTPIRSVGDGVVVEAGYKGGNGNYVTVRHNGTYTTGYLHMSRIAESVRRGMNVRQGQIIGYVGSTGWATGPHLCYRFWKNGVQVDALKVQLPPAEPVQESSRARFISVRDSIRTLLDRIPVSTALIGPADK